MSGSPHQDIILDAKTSLKVPYQNTKPWVLVYIYQSTPNTELFLKWQGQTRLLAHKNRPVILKARSSTVPVDPFYLGHYWICTGILGRSSWVNLYELPYALADSLGRCAQRLLVGFLVNSYLSQLVP